MKITIFGIVQGVGFRPTVFRVAKQMGLRGYVLNNGSNVEVHMDGDPDEFIRKLKGALPALARIDRTELEEIDEDLGEFSIVQSTNGRRVSLIPADTAICDSCEGDFRRDVDKRRLFPFTNCTECGARFTVIEDVPFDRRRTSMTDFPMCASCTAEYANPEDRRFHAQTISCPECGPKYSLWDRDRALVEGDAFAGFAARLDAGEVGLMKGWGGMHIACAFPNAPRLRKLYRRGDKPYAVMLRNPETVAKYTMASEEELRLLTSPQRPIVLLQKAEMASALLEGVSPGLGNVGVMLPYSAAHLLLFHHLQADGVIMTSANLPGQPMVVSNDLAFDLGLDCYLMHNRRIIHRCDDSVVKLISGRTNFIRKSRGYVPLPVKANHERSVIAVGAQWDVTASVTRNGEMFLTQYVGESEQHPTLQFLDDAIHHLRRLLGVEEIEAVALDKHPRYSTRIEARRLADAYGCRMIETQHYHAHAASLKIDGEVEGPLVCLTWDGTGYGDDGTSWGGETLLADYSEYDRRATLQGIPLLGGDRAVVDPKRVVTALELMLGREPSLVEEKAAELYGKMLPKSVAASSMGRVLDAVACILGICCIRTYEGEPAIKLEQWLEKGRVNSDFPMEFSRSGKLEVAMTLPMFEALLDMKLENDREKADAAASFVMSLVSELTAKACDLADQEGLRHVGLSGGVSYSAPISRRVEKVVRSRDLEFVGHRRLCNGDGGISAGQNAIAGSLLG